MTTSETPAGVLLVDLQPGYGGGIGRYLMRDVLVELSRLPESVPLYAFYVNEELSGDTLESVQDFWREHGADESLIERIDWREKSYAFFRGWMDNGVASDDIVAVARALRERSLWDSREADEALLTSLSERGAELCDPLWRDENVERLCEELTRLHGPLLTAGGGREECLAEVELALDAWNVPFERQNHLTY